MQFMPLVMTGMMAWFPCGLVLYWLTNTVLSIVQQWRVNQVVRSRGRQAAILDAVTSARHHRRHRQRIPGGARSGVIRVSGPDVPRIARGILGELPAAAPRAAARIFSTREAIEPGRRAWPCIFRRPLLHRRSMSWSCRAMAARSSSICCCGALLELGLPHGAARRVQRARLLERQDRHRAGRSDRRSDRCRHRRRGRAPRCAPCKASSPRASPNCRSQTHGIAGLCRGGHRFSRRGNRFSFRSGACASGSAQVFAAFESITAAARQGALLREGLTRRDCRQAERRQIQPAQSAGGR